MKLLNILLLFAAAIWAACAFNPFSPDISDEPGVESVSDYTETEADFNTPVSYDEGEVLEETYFELCYDLTDPDLDTSSLKFKGVKALNTEDEWKTYMDFCIKKGYVHIFFEVPEEMTPDTDYFLNAYDITAVTIYTYPPNRGWKIMGYTLTYTYAHDILNAVKNNSLDRLDAKKLAAYNAAQSFLSTIEGLSDYEKELAIHNYVCEKITYSKDEALSDITNCYGGLINGLGNCQAYTDTFSLLCGLEGFDCGRAACKADGTDHSLNYIVINGGYYFVDCTFDDGISDPDRGYGLFYFNAPYDIISADHVFSELPFEPVYTIDEANWYYRNGLYAASPELLEQVYRNIAAQSSQGEILFNTQCGTASLTDIFTKFPCGYKRISVSKFTFGESYEILKFSLSQ
ncbi:MAG: hypothetical protein LIO87_01685 [Eubacterium sp.]|nr:hypothetical protein [Eubacterium sp.]